MGDMKTQKMEAENLSMCDLELELVGKAHAFCILK